MKEEYVLSEEQMEKISAYFPRSRGKGRVDDRRVLSGIVYVLRNGLRWKDAPVGYGPYKTLYNRFVRWSRRGVFERMFAGLAGGVEHDEVRMLDSTYLKAHRTAASLRQKGGNGVSGAPKGA